MEGFTIGHNISDSTPTLSSLRLPGRVSTRVSLLFEVQRVSRAVRKQGIGLNRRRRERLFMKAHHYVAPLSFFFFVLLRRSHSWLNARDVSSSLVICIHSHEYMTRAYTSNIKMASTRTFGKRFCGDKISRHNIIINEFCFFFIWMFKNLEK
jgi:hypothetical protein